MTYSNDEDHLDKDSLLPVGRSALARDHARHVSLKERQCSLCQTPESILAAGTKHLRGDVFCVRCSPWRRLCKLTE